MKVSKLFLAGLFSLGIASIATAKDGDNPGGFGLKGGIGFSTISFGKFNDGNVEINKSGNSWKIGGLVGVTYEHRFGDRFALDIEGLLTNKGVKREDSFNNGLINASSDLKINLYTVDVPLSAKLYFGDNFNVYAGPYFSYILGGNYKLTGDVNGNTSTKESGNWFGNDYKDVNGELPMNRFDIGANIGLEFVSNGGFGVGARFQKGFVDLTNDDYKGTNTTDGFIFPADNKYVTNTGIQVYGIFRF